RIAEPLGTLTDLLAAVARREPARLAELGARFEAELGQLEQVAVPVRAHRFVVRRSGGHLADAIDAVGRCAEPVPVLAPATEALGGALAGVATVKLVAAVARNVVEARRALGRRPGPGYQRPQMPDADADAPDSRRTIQSAVSEIDLAMGVVAAAFA